MTTHKRSDAEIQKAVMEELRWDTRVKETDVGVEVDRGIVTLTGTVDSWPARLAAQEAAHHVADVLDVANDIHVKLPGSALRTDTDIARTVRTALELDVLVPDKDIQSTVANGIVTLEGKVQNWQQYDDAARAIRNLLGVFEVRNRILVAPVTPKVEAQTLRRAIEDALARHAEHAARHVTIDFVDGAIVLRGKIPSWAERQAVVGAVRGTRGVGAVEVQLQVGQ